MIIHEKSHPKKKKKMQEWKQKFSRRFINLLYMLLVPSEGYIVRIKKNRVDKIKIKIKTHQIIKKIKIHTKNKN